MMKGHISRCVDSLWRNRRYAPLFIATLVLSACGTTRAAEAPATPSNEAGSPSAAAAYPEPLRGHWMPSGVACPTPINYDSDSLIVIEARHLAHYEDGNKPVRVEPISDSPQAWSIQSLLNTGGDGYDTSVSEVFALGGRELAIVGADGVVTYHKCD